MTAIADLELPERVTAAFTGRSHLTFPELAEALELDLKTLRRHCDSGHIDWLLKGTGAKRAHRVFTLAQVREFYRRTSGSAPCLSTGTGTARSGNSTSNVVVIDFADRRTSRKGGPSVRPKRSRRKSLGRPSDLLKKSGPLAERR